MYNDDSKMLLEITLYLVGIREQVFTRITFFFKVIIGTVFRIRYLINNLQWKQEYYYMYM